MTDTQGDIVPLPDDLQDCGCRYAKSGRHSTQCQKARQFDALPLSERPGYVEGEQGQRFRAIGWDYPLELRTRVDVTVHVDPLEFIAAHQAAYDGFEQEPGYEEWEKPVDFLIHLLLEDVDEVGGWFHGPLRTCRVDTATDDVENSPRWTREDTERLHAALEARRVDPNQQGLL